MIRTSHSVSICLACLEAATGNQSISSPSGDAEHRRDRADDQHLPPVARAPARRSVPRCRSPVLSSSPMDAASYASRGDERRQRRGPPPTGGAAPSYAAGAQRARGRCATRRSGPEVRRRDAVVAAERLRELGRLAVADAVRRPRARSAPARRASRPPAACARAVRWSRNVVCPISAYARWSWRREEATRRAMSSSERSAAYSRSTMRVGLVEQAGAQPDGGGSLHGHVLLYVTCAYARQESPRHPSESVSLRQIVAMSEDEEAGAMQVRDGMSRVVLTVGPGHTLRQAAAQMARRNVGAAVVRRSRRRGPGHHHRARHPPLGGGRSGPRRRAGRRAPDRASRCSATPEWSLEEAAAAMVARRLPPPAWWSRRGEIVGHRLDARHRALLDRRRRDLRRAAERPRGLASSPSSAPRRPGRRRTPCRGRAAPVRPAPAG